MNLRNGEIQVTPQKLNPVDELFHALDLETMINLGHGSELASLKKKKKKCKTVSGEQEVNLELNVKTYKQFSETQIKNLELSFLEHKYPEPKLIREIARTLSIEYQRVDNWFKYRRRVERRKGSKFEEKRTKFSKEQIITLKKCFVSNKNPSITEYISIAKELQTTTKKVQNWFAYERRSLLSRMNTIVSTMSEDCDQKSSPKLGNFCLENSSSQDLEEKGVVTAKSKLAKKKFWSEKVKELNHKLVSVFKEKMPQPQSNPQIPSIIIPNFEIGPSYSYVGHSFKATSPRLISTNFFPIHIDFKNYPNGVPQQYQINYNINLDTKEEFFDPCFNELKQDEYFIKQESNEILIKNEFQFNQSFANMIPSPLDYFPYKSFTFPGNSPNMSIETKELTIKEEEKSF